MNQKEAVAVLVVGCECGWEARGVESVVVPAVMRHAEESHNMKTTAEQVLAKARPA